MIAAVDWLRRLSPAGRAALATGIFALLVGLFTLNTNLVGVSYDDGLYASLALGLAHGAGYVHASFPGTPAAVHYPPLYPMILAPIFGLLPLGTAALTAKILNLMFGVTAAGLIAWHATRIRLLGDLPWWVPAGVVAAAAVAIPVFRTQATLLSEPLWMLLFAATISATDLPPARPARRVEFAYAPAGILAALTVLTRSIGVVLLVGPLLYLLVLRREPWRRVLTFAIPVLVGVVGWFIWVGVHRSGIDPAVAFGYGSLNEPLRQSGLSFLPGNLLDLPRPLGSITLAYGLPLPPGLVRITIGCAALLVLITGLVKLFTRSSIGFTLLAYLGILAVWPYAPDRFIWGVLPWLALAFAAGAAALWRANRRLQVVVAVIVLLVGFGYVRYEIRGLTGQWWEIPEQAISDNFRELLPAVAGLPPEAVIASDNEALVWLYTRRQAVPLAMFAWEGDREATPRPADHRAFLDRHGVTHVLLASGRGGTARQLRDLIEAYPGWLVPLRSWPGGRWLFEVSKR